MSTLSLDSEQQAVVDYQGSQVVIAGPGSGKTRTLVAKAEKLYQETCDDFICLTFTRAAAREVRERIPSVEAKTIHSYCYSKIGWTGDYNTMLEVVLEAKRKGVLKDKYDVVLVDEVQDLTKIQWEVVESLVGKYLFAVGDPYQSIYGWNRALGRGMFDILRDYGCKEFKLLNNYRSSPKIVNLLNKHYPRGLVSKGTKDLGTTVILARTNALVTRITKDLDRTGIGYTVRFGSSELSTVKEENHGSDLLRVMTCHCSKGLEFDKVILYGWSPEPYFGFNENEDTQSRELTGYPGEEEENLLYVAQSRASKEFIEVSGYNGLMEALKK